MAREKTIDLARKGALAIEPYATPPVYGASVKLNQNESPYDIPDDIKREIQKEILSIGFNRYPDASCEELRLELAEYARCGPENIVVGNGADEIIYYAGLAFMQGGQKAVVPAPSFMMYEIVSRLMECKTKMVRLGKGFGLTKEFEQESRGARMTFICSPNNPTANSTPSSLIEKIAREASGLVMVDEAYGEFASQSVLRLAAKKDNLLALKTFSKAFSAAGLRIGYSVASEEVTAILNRVRLPWNVSSFAQKTAAILLRNRQAFEKNVELIKKERARVTGQLAKIPGVKVFPTDANFYMLETPLAGTDLFTRLWKKGILVRDVSRAPLLQKCVRANVGTPEEDDELVSALEEIASGMRAMEW